MAALRQASNVAAGCVAATPRAVRDASSSRRVRVAALDSAMAGAQLKGVRTGASVVEERRRRRSAVSQAVSVDTEKELELNIADDVTQVRGFHAARTQVSSQCHVVPSTQLASSGVHSAFASSALFSS